LNIFIQTVETNGTNGVHLSENIQVTFRTSKNEENKKDWNRFSSW